MTKEYELGQMNGHAIGRILKEGMRRAMVLIHKERAIFDSEVKVGHSGKMDDVKTSADDKAQEIYLRTFRECFPNFGVIAEEEKDGKTGYLIIESNGIDAYFTVDPLDGTKAYVRRQSHGIGTMVGLVHEGEIISAYVGDINTEEVYGYRPGSNKVFRITRLDQFEVLGYTEEPKPSERYALLRDNLDLYSPTTRSTVLKFKNHEIMGSSIGIWMARLWKREVGAAFLHTGFETPWDSTPIIGISQKLGYVYMKPRGNRVGWEEYQPLISREKYMRDHDVMIIHRNDLGALYLD